LDYRLVLLDLDNTLYDTRATERLAFGEFLSAYTAAGDAEALFKGYRALNGELWYILESGGLQVDDFNTERFRRFFELAAIAGDAETAGRHYLDLLVKHHLFYPQAEAIYEYLTKKYQVALITNGLKSAQYGRIRQTFLDQKETKMYIGEEMGNYKPSAEVIDHVMQEEGVGDKQQVIIIGDSLSSDIQCAMNAGISSIWCNFTGEEVGEYKPDHIVYDLMEIKNIL
jgi:2-haloacid dehalogenase